MKKKLSILLTAFMLIAMLAGCGNKFSPDENAIYIKKDGKVVQVSMESLDQSYYDEDELEQYINDEIDAYDGGENSSVKLQNFKVKDGVADLQLEFDSYETYSDFNGRVLFAGTVAQAIAAGYDFEQNFTSITDAESSDAAWSRDSSGNAVGDASSADISSLLEANCVITGEQLQVKVAGTITYVSSEGTKMISKDTVKAGRTDGELTYIIYE